MKKRILFIINPISGNKKGKHIVSKIEKLIDKNRFELSISISQHQGHANQLAKEAVGAGVDIVVAVGGDGTINEVASALVHSDATLGILPIGSGNGLARHLSIPLKVDKAIAIINQCAEIPRKIDVGMANKHYFFSMAGIGYDAKVAYDFNRDGERNFTGYFKHIVRSYFRYHSSNYIISCNNKTLNRRAFFISLANSGQWGYNVKIKPDASLFDGKLDIIIAKKPNFFILSYILIALFIGKISQSRIIETFQTNKIDIRQKNDNLLFLHLDGDAIEPTLSVDIELLPAALKVVTAE